MGPVYNIQDFPIEPSFDQNGNIILKLKWPMPATFMLSIKNAAEFCHRLNAVVQAAEFARNNYNAGCITGRSAGRQPAPNNTGRQPAPYNTIRCEIKCDE